MAEVEINQPDFTNGVFGNNLIFSIVSKYLDIPDLKILRQTCKLLLSEVNGVRGFLSNLRVTVSDEISQENRMGYSFAWKNAKIVNSPTSSHHFPCTQTASIENLELLHPENPTSENWNNQHSRSACYEILGIKRFPNLRSLILDLNLLYYNIPIFALSGIVENVKEFRFSGIRKFCLKGDNCRTAVRNLKMMGGLPWKLKSFAIEGFELQDRIARAVGAIPVSSASTLEELKICCVDFRDSKISRVPFERLRILVLELNGGGEYSRVSNSLENFLNIQPQLEALEINCNRLRLYRGLDPSVSDAIRRICSSKLHTLRLRGAKWFRAFHDVESWTFVRSLTGLNDFMFCGAFNTTAEDVTEEILNSLPNNIQSLELHQLYYNLKEDEHEHGTIALAGFSNLVHLRIIKCKGLMNDVILQIICGNLTKLRVLQFGSDGAEITDFGLTGERANYNSGVSLRNLKGLHDLDISSTEITKDGILKAIQFQELRNLRLSTYISDETLVALASNNPSLELVSRGYGIAGEAPFSLDEYHRELFSNILTVNPRLTRIHTEEFQNLKDDVPDDAFCRPSYGVLASPSNAVTCIRNAMEICKTSKEVFSNDYYDNDNLYYSYYYNMNSIK